MSIHLDSNKRQIRAEIQELNTFSTEIASLPPSKQGPLRQAADDLAIQMADALEENPESKAEDLIANFGEPLRELLCDDTKEPFDQGAVQGSDDRLYSLSTVIKHVYTEPCPQRDRAPLDPQNPHPWTVAKRRQSSIDRIVRLFARNKVPLTPSAKKIELCKWLHLPLALEADVGGLTPFGLGVELKKTVGALLAKVELSTQTHQDELSRTLCDNWCKPLLRDLSRIRDPEGILRAGADEWTILQSYVELLDGFLSDPLDGAPLQEGALLANDEERHTYNPESAEELKKLYPQLLFQPHPHIKPFLDFLKEASEKLKPLLLHKRRQALAEKVQRIKIEETAHQKILQEALDSVREIEKRIGAVEQRVSGVDAATDALAARLLQEDAHLASLRESMQTCAKGAKALKTKVLSFRTGVEQTAADLKEIQKEAQKLQQTVQQQQREIFGKIEQLQSKNKQIEETLGQAERQVDQIAATQLEIEKGINELRIKLAKRQNGFLRGLLAVAGFGIGILTGTVVMNVAIEAGMAAATATTLGTLTGATVTGGLHVATSSPENNPINTKKDFYEHNNPSR